MLTPLSAGRKLHCAFNFAVFDEPSRELQTLRGAESSAWIFQALLGCCFASFFLGRVVERFEKLLAEFAIAFGDESQDFAAQIWTAAEYGRPAFGFQSLHLLGAFLCGVSVNGLGGFPGAAEELSGAFGVGVPEYVSGSRLHACATCLVLEAAGLVRETADEGNRDCSLLRGLGVSFFGCDGLGFLGLGESN
jgi:hypothetical protein